MKNLLLFICLAIAVPLTAQHKVGVRAGLNYSNFKGDTETGETYGLSNGFHFGINYTYEFTDVFGLRGELLYIQRGTKQDFLSDDVYNIIKPLNSAQFVEIGTVDMKSEISIAYLSIPITGHFQLHRKFEVLLEYIVFIHIYFNIYMFFCFISLL